jgi:hypothetical protein
VHHGQHHHNSDRRDDHPQRETKPGHSTSLYGRREQQAAARLESFIHACAVGSKKGGQRGKEPLTALPEQAAKEV